MIQAIILEDETSAKEVLQSYIDKTPFIKNIGTFESGVDIPMEVLNKAHLLFLDIQLPELNGLSFLKTLENPPKVIITTAYPNFAVEAFEEAVTDYLVKPFSYERFFKAVTRVRNQLRELNNTSKDILYLYANKTIYKIETQDILYLKAEVDYVNFVTTSQEILVLDSLKNWEEKLQPMGFTRVHRSYIVNNNKVDKITGNQVFINNNALPISSTYKDQFLKTLNS